MVPRRRRVRGPAMLADDLRPQFAGIERRLDRVRPAQVALHAHSGACLLLRDFAQLKESFDADPSYIHQDKDLTRRRRCGGGTGRSSAGASGR